ncbi:MULTISPECIES: Nif11-like leader peptide family natural product precursor [Microcystis]|jgi:hypothetical protein|uniref:Nif11-like leader peptide family natural product precursor n=1 Tax=Microcystis TaxID=1125 RepID=UPI0011EB9137|nr:MULTISPECIES: Nif11-like leader peptide family natural product precursor [Microcystis]MCA2938720.1 Nif11-like leader peptide family natural product precursor [Microcystis sp. M113S1]TYT72714.1 hypothetical protein FXO09_02305 [Microcystis aeruginosa KLA2]
MSPRSFAAFLNEVKSDKTFARDLKSALVSVNKNEIPGIVADLARKKGMEVDIESLQASMNIASAPDFSDGEIEIVKGPIMATFWLLSCDCNCYSKTPNSNDNPAC